ncbi:DNA repair exonuclease SbcCD nuclease subunit [Haloarcula vallismortis]|uniref:DNA double-strand break repair protein Mre11 n=2 Tax=Haloarcula vallismortis TaxID=28442 RepID=M0JCV3_HALVA|nr:DNA double-strand break repair protein Mre11 [Haloarcula vallismortis]EMA06816.1 phosphoesterase [Haloarcula vallismortis ATCC 29715]SDW66311.1 DNA repair exonuclease SbcCD nuclease subunit [Haloarcula vallismortis]
MTRVIHTGDTHVGYQQYNVPDRRDDFLGAFRQVVRDAIADDADAVVHAGDLFHDRRPALADIMGTLSVLEELSEADIPFLAVVGNHEAKRDAQWLDLYESLGLATRLGDEPTVIGDTAFYGLDFVPRSQRDDLDYDFAPHDADSAALVTHGLFQPFDYGDWDAAEILTESSVTFDALLLGDNHDPGKQQVEDAWVTYCGSTERASASEREDRGYNIVTFDDEVRITRRGLDTREFVFVDVDLGPEEGVERVRSRVGQHDLEEAVVIVSISGDGDPVTPASVESFALDQGALVARVTDHREITAEERETEISFADPDDAVTERVRDLGLSEAAHDIDETIRASKVADANVKDEVERHVRELLSDDSAALAADAEAAASDSASDTDATASASGDDTDGAPVNEADGTDSESQASVEEFL